MMAPLNTAVSPAARPQIDALGAAIPVIQTERLTLRAPRLSDWAILEPIWTTARGEYIGGPMSAEDGWLDFNHLVASWVLRGYGALTIEHTADKTVLGVVLLEHEMGDPEPELGWLLTEAGEGKGYAFEAAAAILPLGVKLFGTGNFVSYIHQDNVRSIRLAKKLGAIADQNRHPGFPEGLVYRHGRHA